MSISEIINNRCIREVLHFTTNKGVLGVLDAKALKARARLNVDARLEYIFQPNAKNRTRDEKFLDYVNLSISRINNNFFSVSAGSWHRFSDLWWCVLSFSPEILNHDNVIFTTTNNIYSGVTRGTGENGLEALFATSVTQWHGKTIYRSNELDSCMTTCEQAEILYPGELSTQFLQTIYVPNEEIADELTAQIVVVGHTPIDIKIDSKLFRNLA